MGWGTNEKLNEIDTKVDQIQATLTTNEHSDELAFQSFKKQFEALVKDVEEIKSTVNQILSILQSMQSGPAVGFKATVSKP